LKFLADYKKRDLFYSTLKNEWEQQMPTDNWCLVLISNSNNEKTIDKVISKSITNNVCYIVGIGTQQDYIHNQADTEYVMRDIGQSNFPQPKYHVITVGEKDLDEGIWYSLNLTFKGDTEINKIQIIDLDCKWKNEIVKLLTKFKEDNTPNN